MELCADGGEDAETGTVKEEFSIGKRLVEDDVGARTVKIGSHWIGLDGWKWGAEV